MRVLPFSRKIRPFRGKFQYQLLPNLIRHAHAKFAPLDFVNKKMIGKCRVFFNPNQTSPFKVDREDHFYRPGS